MPASKLKAFKSRVGERRDSTIPKDKLEDFKSGVSSFELQKGIKNKENYYQAACQAIGIPYEREEGKVYHNIGQLEMSSSVDALDAIVSIYRLNGHYVYGYEEYLDACKRKGNIERQIESIRKHRQQEDQRYLEFNDRYDDWVARDADTPAPRYYEKPPPDMPSERDLEFLSVYDLRTFKLDEKGFLAYIQEVAPSLYSQIISTPLPLFLEENPDRPHGYILGTPGSGKSELLKLLVHTYVTHKQYGSVVVIDPSSDFVKQIARWKEFNTTNRLIYIRPTLAKGMSPVINPFEIDGVEATDYSEEAINVKRVVAQELVEALGRIIAEGGSLTPHMKTILTNCVLTLLDKEDSTLKDLSRFMRNDSELIAFACKLNHHEYMADYFQSKESGFFAKGNPMTKDAIGRRLDELLSVGTFNKLTCGKNTINLVEAVNQKKVILFDLGKGAIGKKEGAAFGRLVIGMLMGMAFRRENLKKEDRVPCALVIDECHNFISESMEEILTEARKYRLLLTLAQQTAGQRMPPALKDAVLETTNLQVVGGTSASGAKRNADIVGVNPDDVRKLKIGEFFVRSSRSGSPIKFKTRTDLLDWRNCVTKESWRRIVRDQIKKHYQQYDSSIKTVIEDEEPDITPQTW